MTHTHKKKKPEEEEEKNIAKKNHRLVESVFKKSNKKSI